MIRILQLHIANLIKLFCFSHFATDKKNPKIKNKTYIYQPIN